MLLLPLLLCAVCRCGCRSRACFGLCRRPMSCVSSYFAPEKHIPVLSLLLRVSLLRVFVFSQTSRSTSGTSPCHTPLRPASSLPFLSLSPPKFSCLSAFRLTPPAVRPPPPSRWARWHRSSPKKTRSARGLSSARGCSRPAGPTLPLGFLPAGDPPTAPRQPRQTPPPLSPPPLPPRPPKAHRPSRHRCRVLRRRPPPLVTVALPPTARGGEGNRQGEARRAAARREGDGAAARP